MTSRVLKVVRCPHCSARNSNVYRSLPPENGSRVQYRLCRQCGFTFKTIIEVLDPQPIPRRRRRLPRRPPP